MPGWDRVQRTQTPCQSVTVTRKARPTSRLFLLLLLPYVAASQLALERFEQRLDDAIEKNKLVIPEMMNVSKFEWSSESVAQWRQCINMLQSIPERVQEKIVTMLGNKAEHNLLFTELRHFWSTVVHKTEKASKLQMKARLDLDRFLKRSCKACDEDSLGNAFRVYLPFVDKEELGTHFVQLVIKATDTFVTVQGSMKKYLDEHALHGALNRKDDLIDWFMTSGLETRWKTDSNILEFIKQQGLDRDNVEHQKRIAKAYIDNMEWNTHYKRVWDIQFDIAARGQLWDHIEEAAHQRLDLHVAKGLKSRPRSQSNLVRGEQSLSKSRMPERHSTAPAGQERRI